jgi:hypothetical protein
VKRWSIVGFIGALVVAVSAQELSSSAENVSVNLRVRYPENWSAEAIPDFGFVLQDFEGWTLSIGIGEAITSSFADVPDAAPTMPAVAAILEIAKLLDPDSYNLDEVNVITLPQGDALRLSGTVTEEGVTVPIVLLTFNLPSPDGRLVVATLFNEQTLDIVNPSVYTDYEAIVGTIEALSAAVPPIAEMPTTGGPVAIADMPPNTLIFDSGISVTFPDGWAIFDEEPVVRNSASLFKGSNYFRASALLIISVNSLTDLPLEFVDSFMLPMLAPVYMGRDDFDPERDIVSETLEDGRFFRYLNTNPETSLGNIYIVQVDDNNYLMVIATIINQDAATLAEAEAIARSATAAPVELGQGGPSEPDSAEPPAVVVPDLPVTQIECRTSAFDLTFDAATQQALVQCPANCSGSVWGTDIYTADSSVCTAAAHAGAISRAEGGRVLVTSLPGQDSYAGTTRNEITTSSWGSYRASFSVAPAGDAPSSAPSSGFTAPSVNVRQLGLQPQPATCDLRVSTDVINESSVYALFECPAGCDQEYYAIWGTDVYTGDSYLCAAAIHAGAISRAGGLVLVTWRPGQESYADSERNGLVSASWGGWGESFITQGVDPATGQTR